MKKYYSYLCFFLLSIYCAVLISLEIKYSEDFVRNFFTDIQGDVPFYAVNTSLSVCLLSATALMFVVNLASLPPEKSNKNTIRFYQSQVILFGFLACDDRFLIHEHLGYLLKINDALIILSLGILEIVFIWAWSNFRQWDKSTKKNLFWAAIFLGIMIAIDGFFPQDMIARLSLEDLSKTWSNVFIFSYSWSIFQQNITILKKNKAQNLQIYDRLSEESESLIVEKVSMQ